MAIQALQKFREKCVLVIGDLMLDEYIRGSVDRISPEAPVPVVVEKERKSVPGGAGNVVNNLISLGSRVILIGTLGEDDDARILREAFFQKGLHESDLSAISLPGRPTTKKTRIMAGNQQVCRLDRENISEIGEEKRKEILKAVEDRIGECHGIIFSDYDKGVITPDLIEKTVAMAQKGGVFVAVDPQVTHFDYYRRVDVLTPNHHEAGRYLGRKLHTDEEVKAGGFEIMKRLGSAMLLITRGEKGMTLFEAKSETCRNFPTMAREVFDVTGAGDTVISIFTLAMTAGASPQEAVLLSNRGAGIVVGRLGASTVTTSELESSS